MNGKSFAQLDLTVVLDIEYKEYNAIMFVDFLYFFQLICSYMVARVFRRLLGSYFLAQQAECFNVQSKRDDLFAKYVQFQVRG